MGDDWVCQDCNYGTDEKPNKDECPLCKGSMVNIGAVDEDLKPTKGVYGKDELDTPMEPLDDDFLADDEIVEKEEK